MLTRTLIRFTRALLLLVAVLPLVVGLHVMPQLFKRHGRVKPISWHWQNMGAESDLITIESISLLPDPPQPGRPVTLYVEGTASQEIERGAEYFAEMKYGSKVLFKGWMDFCELTLESGYYCPILPGEFHLEQTFDMPDKFPSGKFRILSIAQTRDGAEMFYVRSEFIVGR